MGFGEMGLGEMGLGEMGGHRMGLPNFFEYPLLSQEWVKLRTSNFVGTFLVSIGTKAHKNFGKSSRRRTQGLAKKFQGTHV